jgi:hypothetical protein
MSRHLPYAAATTVTLAAGAITSLVRAATVTAAPVPHDATPAGAHATVGPQTPSPRASPPGNTANAPTSAWPAFPPANANLAAGPGAAPAVTPAAVYGQAGMNQPGQAAFGETFVSNQTWMNQPGQPDFYGGANPNVLQANQGVAPSSAYPSPWMPQTGASPPGAAPYENASPNTVGFYNGFGPGQPSVGFYAGFTTPR